jgi:2,4-dienoyl-CoA reductase-like NADH-dependent reductase (Old Yellow Enzyme family)/thioredoxin reductase
VSVSEQFEYLFKPLKIGPMTVRNRIFMSGAATRFYPGDGVPDDRSLAFWEARAAGGAGLLTIPCYPFPLTTFAPPTALGGDDDKAIPVLEKVAQMIHKYGTRCFGQLNHPGNYYPGRSFGGGATWSPSPVYRVNRFVPGLQENGHEMEVEDIKRAVGAYSVAAAKFKKAGFDGIEIAAISGCLLGQFISPAMNIRTDEYGGNLENRIRILLEIIDAVRESVGGNLAVGVRFTADEFLDWTWWSKESGNTLESAKEIAKKLEATGKLDYLFPCVGTEDTVHMPSMYFPIGSFVHMSAEIKREINLPVFTIGRINDPVQAEQILSSHQADMIGMFRGLVADPELPKKAQEGRLEEIRHCIGCNHGCVGTFTPRLPLSCTVNVQAGREKTFVISPAESKRKVLIVGGGAAGLEAARVAALRGHNVSLYEKEDILAKNLILAAQAPGRGGWEDAARYYTYQMKILKVNVQLGMFVSPGKVEEMVKREGYEAVVIATGATPFIPEVRGIDTAEVKILEAHEVLEKSVEVGGEVLVVAYENHSIGLTTADYLVEKGKRVEVIIDSVYAGSRFDWSTLSSIYTRLLANKVIITPLSGLTEVRGKNLIVCNVQTGEKRIIDKMDTVIFATDGRPNDALYRSLKGKVSMLYQIGQCLAPRSMLDSVLDGAMTASEL